jgi:hypothetical protein
MPIDLRHVRCLGGLPATLPDGSMATTVPGRVLRTSAFALRAPGAAVALAPITTVVDLRNAGEGEGYPLPTGAVRHLRPVEDPTDAEFRAAWGGRLGSPAYWPEILRRWPAMLVAAVRTVAQAPDGAVLVHCAAGRDRTGQVAALLLTLAGVAPEVVADADAVARRDAEEQLRAEPRGAERAREPAAFQAYLASSRTELLAFVTDPGLVDALRVAGLTRADVAGVRRRLLAAA